MGPTGGPLLQETFTSHHPESLAATGKVSRKKCVGVPDGEADRGTPDWVKGWGRVSPSPRCPEEVLSFLAAQVFFPSKNMGIFSSET